MTQLQYIHIAFEFWAAVFCIIAAMCVFAARFFQPKAAWSLVVLLCADAALNIAEIIFYANKGKTDAASVLVLKACIFIIIEIRFAISALAALHLESFVYERGGAKERHLTIITYLFSVIGGTYFLLLVMLGRAIEPNSLSHSDINYIIQMILLLLAGIPIIIRVVKNQNILNKREYIALSFYSIVPFLGTILQSLFANISAYNMAISIALIAVVFIYHLGYAEITIETERLRADEKLRFYQSQIQPHIIFNSLAAIRSYIPIDCEARDILDDFTGFLRGRIDMLHETKCVKARREFEVVSDYLALAQNRFSEKLTVKKDIQDEDFMIPPFTVQTMVENAIRHGIRARDDGSGTLEIKSYEDTTNHIVEVIDDGVGFDTGLLNEMANRWQNGSSSERKHIGIYVARERLAMMCDGKLEIVSEIQKGTTVRILIPKERKADYENVDR